MFSICSSASTVNATSTDLLSTGSDAPLPCRSVGSFSGPAAPDREGRHQRSTRLVCEQLARRVDAGLRQLDTGQRHIGELHREQQQVESVAEAHFHRARRLNPFQRAHEQQLVQMFAANRSRDHRGVAPVEPRRLRRMQLFGKRDGGPEARVPRVHLLRRALAFRVEPALLRACGRALQLLRLLLNLREVFRVAGRDALDDIAVEDVRDFAVRHERAAGVDRDRA
jgi:hypothetical protein